MRPTSFVHDGLPGRVVFGAGASHSAIVGELDRLGAQRVMLIASPGEYDRAREPRTMLGGRVVTAFTDVRPHVPTGIVHPAREQARQLGIDCLLPIGGGSAIGTAKAVALDVPIPILAIPTTYSGSEMTPIWGITENAVKTTGRAASVQPATVIYDPELTRSLPTPVTGPSGMNALAHCLEALYAPRGNPVTSLLAHDGIRALAGGLPAAVADPADLDARSELLYGACLAGMSIAAAGSGIHHTICHVLGGTLDLPHAETHTVVLPHVVAFNEPVLGETMAAVAATLGADTAAAGLHALATRIGAPSGLRDLGMTDTDVDHAARVVAEKDLSANPRPVDVDDVRNIILRAFHGCVPAPDSNARRGESGRSAG